MPNTKKITHPWGETGLTLYCVIRREADGYLLNDADGAFANAPADPYIAMTEDGTLKGLYEKSEARAAWNDGVYTVMVYSQAGASPAPASDTVIGSGEFYIDTDTEVNTSTIKTNIDTISLAVTTIDTVVDTISLAATTIDTVVDMAEDTAKETQNASARVKASANKANEEKEKMNELLTEMEHITEISKEIGNIITDIEDIASQTNLLSLNASIEAARAGEAGKGFAVVADQIGKLAADSAKSAVNTRDLIDKTLVEIEKGNTITRTTADAFNQIIADMESFAEIAQNTMEKANSQAESLEQIGQGIEQLSGVVQGNAASSEENTAISINLAEGAAKMHDRVNIFKLF